MSLQAHLDDRATPEENKTINNICLRFSILEKSVELQSQQLNALQNATDETAKRISILYESVANKEKVMEARARICNDRPRTIFTTTFYSHGWNTFPRTVQGRSKAPIQRTRAPPIRMKGIFLIEAAAGRKDDVFNAIETLFKSSQNTSERLTTLEKSVTKTQVEEFRNGDNMRGTDSGVMNVGLKSDLSSDYSAVYFPHQKRRRVVPPSRIVSNIYDELWDNISLPGVRFVGQGKNWLHRYLWVILHLSTFAISFNYIKESYDAWQNSPVVMSLNNSLTRVADIPFPAITICSLPSINNDYNITHEVKRCLLCTNESMERFCQLADDCTDLDVLALASAIVLCNCRHELTTEQEKLIDDIIQNNLTITEQFSIEIKHKILPVCHRHYLFLGESPKYEYSCEHVHRSLMEFSDTPVCVTFNSLCPNDLYWGHVVPSTLDERDVNCKITNTNLTWTTDTMMVLANKNDSVPLYRETKLDILFKKPKNLRVDTCNEGNDANSKIGLHHPGEVPMEENTRFYSFRTERDINIYITPTLITAQKNLGHYEPSIRGCYFSHEMNLTSFKFYTRKNCQMECKANCSMEICKCVPHFLPRHNSSVRICYTKTDELCVQYKLSDLAFTGHPACHCDCLPDCTSLSYDFSIDDVEIEPKQMGSNFTSITIKYKELEFSSKLRYELRNLADFVADSGGFLGVFNGFSFMVVCELFYFLTVRLWSSIKKNWRLAAEEENTNNGNIENSFIHCSNKSEII